MPVNSNSSSLFTGLGGTSASGKLPSLGSRVSGDGLYVVGLYSWVLGCAQLFVRRTGSSSARRRNRATSRARSESVAAAVSVPVFVGRPPVAVVTVEMFSAPVFVFLDSEKSVRRVANSPRSAWTPARSVATSKRSALTLASWCWSLARRFVTQVGSAAARAAGI